MNVKVRESPFYAPKVGKSCRYWSDIGALTKNRELGVEFCSKAVLQRFKEKDQHHPRLCTRKGTKYSIF